MWLYSSPLEALVVVVITGTDRTVISYININSLVIPRTAAILAAILYFLMMS